MKKSVTISSGLLSFFVASAALANPIELVVAHHQGFGYQQPQSIHDIQINKFLCG